MFYAAEALLWREGRSSNQHSGVHSLYGELFARTARLDPKFHRWMLDAFDQRVEGDYGFDAEIPPERVQELIEQASEFLAAAEAFLSH